MQQQVLQSIRNLLQCTRVAYREIHHEPTFTSEQSALARGERNRIGGKSLVIKVGTDFRLFVLHAIRKLDSSAIRRHFKEKETRFATPAELQKLTGLVPGCIPPFGQPILPFVLFADPSILANVDLAFNAGSLTDSIIMSTVDYLRVAQPTVFPFALETKGETQQ